MKKVFTVVGARPQFVKAATVSRAIQKTEGIEEVLVHTGQHFDKNMSDVFFDEMDIPKPDHHLDIHSLNHGAMTGRMMEGLEKLMLEEKPDVVLIYGDTNSTLAGAVTASKLHIPVAHVEAGLRSFNMEMPEEVNRILADRVSNILYCPTETAKKNLRKEGYENIDARIVISGDVMYDAALFYAEKSEEMSSVTDNIESDRFVLCTLHRAENTDDPAKLASICSALNKINEDRRVILPLHPRTKKLLDQHAINLDFDTIDPVGYFDMIALLKGCELVLTDSGGLQKEAYFFKKPCVTMREQTEWVELIEEGVNILTGSDGEKILNAADEMTQKNVSFDNQLYGDGHAADLIVEDLLNYLNSINE